ncbi:DUF2848 family protein [Lysinibacillus irui]|uniref:DUF2848 family protein n=1 Tax=Lysinibacillus irui TaxID=2998077 RepID=UPI003D298641
MKKSPSKNPKQVCSKPISSQFWLLDDIASRWDDIEMRSWMAGEWRETRNIKREHLVSSYIQKIY